VSIKTIFTKLTINFILTYYTLSEKEIIIYLTIILTIKKQEHAINKPIGMDTETNLKHVDLFCPITTDNLSQTP
jgi:hypothetical protein